jgi:hypothetical protein
MVAPPLTGASHDAPGTFCAARPLGQVTAQ